MEMAPVSMVVSVSQWVTPFNASVQRVSPENAVKLILMNALPNHVSMGAHALIYHRVTDVNVHRATLESIARKSNLTAVTIPVQQEPCARTSRASITTLACVAAVTLALIVISLLIHVQQMVILAAMVPLVSLCNKEDSNANASLDGRDRFVRSIPMIVLRSHVF